MKYDEDTLIRHIKRTPGVELIEKWKQKGIFIPQSYAMEFLEFDKFCKEHDWTFSEGLVYIVEEDLRQKKIKADEDLQKIQSYK